MSWAAWRWPRVVTARAGHPRATAQQSQTLQPELGRGAQGVGSPQTRSTATCASGEDSDAGLWRRSKHQVMEL